MQQTQICSHKTKTKITDCAINKARLIQRLFTRIITTVHPKMDAPSLKTDDCQSRQQTGTEAPHFG